MSARAWTISSDAQQAEAEAHGMHPSCRSLSRLSVGLFSSMFASSSPRYHVSRVSRRWAGAHMYAAGFQSIDCPACRTVQASTCQRCHEDLDTSSDPNPACVPAEAAALEPAERCIRVPLPATPGQLPEDNGLCAQHFAILNACFQSPVLSRTSTICQTARYV